MDTPGPVYGQDPAVGGWIAARLTRPGGLVTGTVPDGYAAYVRILHPVDDDTHARWADVAADEGTRVHRLVQWHRLVRAEDPYDAWSTHWPDDRPATGDLPANALAALVEVLRRHTTTPQECWFGTWEGHGWVHGSPSVAVLDSSGRSQPVPPAFPAEAMDAARLELPGRTFLIGRGPVEAALGNGWHPAPDWFSPQSPNLLWPTDRTWFVSTEIDFDSTLVAGSQALADALLAAPGLEAWPVQPEDSLRVDADEVN